ncbi:hypothetical protein [Streptomyces sp. DH12]|uniref:hypothetical protein n=1 Tax=Streptomyces sp. DH12 TaxID=2857010 RepID=UPI001E426B32|nr:hypothetical protein [Streptomyces sp. DH12]
MEIVTGCVKQTYAATCLALLTVGLTASPAAAGGVLPIASPAFGTSCTNHHGTRADGTTTHGTGAANGNLAGLPAGSPLNHCGGADLLGSSGPLSNVLGQGNSALGVLVPANSGMLSGALTNSIPIRGGLL